MNLYKSLYKQHFSDLTACNKQKQHNNPVWRSKVVPNTPGRLPPARGSYCLHASLIEPVHARLTPATLSYIQLLISKLCLRLSDSLHFCKGTLLAQHNSSLLPHILGKRTWFRFYFSIERNSIWVSSWRRSYCWFILKSNEILFISSLFSNWKLNYN